MLSKVKFVAKNYTDSAKGTSIELAKEDRVYESETKTPGLLWGHYIKIDKTDVSDITVDMLIYEIVS